MSKKFWTVMGAIALSLATLFALAADAAIKPYQTYPHDPNLNQPEAWVTIFERNGYTGVACTKVNGNGTTWVSDGDYIGVIIKAGDGQKDKGDPYDANEVYLDVKEGTELSHYYTGKDISHIVKCTGMKGDEPSEEPTEPTEKPTDPTEKPTDPTEKPTDPTQKPTDPTQKPTDPTQKPTDPTQKPTDPTEEPTAKPTEKPTEGPTAKPTAKPSKPGRPGLPPTGY